MGLFYDKNILKVFRATKPELGKILERILQPEGKDKHSHVDIGKKEKYQDR